MAEFILVVAAGSRGIPVACLPLMCNASECFGGCKLVPPSRSEGSSLGLVARHTHVFQELGITRGQYTGLLPLLVRHGVAELFLMPEQDAAAAAASSSVGKGLGEDDEGWRGAGRGPAADGGWAEVWGRSSGIEG